MSTHHREARFVQGDQVKASLFLNRSGFLGFTGMRYRMELPEDEGMLFDFLEEANHTFWMADVSIPLDIIFLDSGDKIVYIHKDAESGSREPISSNTLVKNVIEVNAGWCDRNGVSVGTYVYYCGLTVG